MPPVRIYSYRMALPEASNAWVPYDNSETVPLLLNGGESDDP